MKSNQQTHRTVSAIRPTVHCEKMISISEHERNWAATRSKSWCKPIARGVDVQNTYITVRFPTNYVLCMQIETLAAYGWEQHTELLPVCSKMDTYTLFQCHTINELSDYCPNNYRSRENHRNLHFNLCFFPLGTNVRNRFRSIALLVCFFFQPKALKLNTK